MDYDPSKYDSTANDALGPGEYLIQLIRQHVSDASQPLTIVDFGCGPGNTAQALANHFENSQIIGLDIDPEMIAYAKSKHQDQTDRFHFAVLNLDQAWVDWPEELKTKLTGKVDVIFSNYTLHWIDNPKLIAESMKLMLKPSGFFAGNLLYCGDLSEVLPPDATQEAKLLSEASYPIEGKFLWLWKAALEQNFGKTKYDPQYPVSRYPKNYYSESFINIPLNWYRKYYSPNLTQNDQDQLDALIKRLILKQRVVKEITHEDGRETEIDIKQKLWILTASKPGEKFQG